MDIFKDFNGKGKNAIMQDITVDNADNSESEIIALEPDEEASSVEKDQVDVASEALAAFQGAKLMSIRQQIVAKHSKLRKLHAALSTSGMNAFMHDVLMEEGVIDPGATKVIGDSAAEDAEEAAKEATPDDIADKGASEEELVKESQMCIKAQCRVLQALYNKVMKI